MVFPDKLRSVIKARPDGDEIDRVNNYWTPMIFALLALMIYAEQLVGDPIQCWFPAQFTDPWAQYAKNYCYVQNTYFLPLNHSIPGQLSDRKDREIGYYQWVPHLLALQAILFYSPVILWRYINGRSGIAVDSIVTMAKEASEKPAAEQEGAIRVAASHIFSSLRVRARMMNSWTHSPAFLTFVYLIIKLLYVVQAAAQFMVLNSFLSTKYTFFCIGMLMDFVNGRDWEESGYFPRVTMCDFWVWKLGAINHYTVQCVLRINMVNEKVFLFVWCMLLVVAVATIASLFLWFFTMSNEESSKQFVTEYLHAKKLIDTKDATTAPSINRFVFRTLKTDGVFLCRLLKANFGDLFVAEIVKDLWRRYKEEQKKAIKKPLSAIEAPKE